MEQLARSSLRGFRWLFAALAVLVVIATVLGTVNASAVENWLFLLIPTAAAIALGYLAVFAADALLAKLVALAVRFVPWMLIAVGVATVAGGLLS